MGDSRITADEAMSAQPLSYFEGMSDALFESFLHSREAAERQKRYRQARRAASRKKAKALLRRVKQQKKRSRAKARAQKGQSDG